MGGADFRIHIGEAADARGAAGQEIPRQAGGLPGRVEAAAAAGALALDAVDQKRPDLVPPPTHPPQGLVQMGVALHQPGQQQQPGRILLHRPWR
ncbi:MAG: hypothetical protein B7Z52_06610, partial [Burkholderiales bacterium 12-64-5]